MAEIVFCKELECTPVILVAVVARLGPLDIYPNERERGLSEGLPGWSARHSFTPESIGQATSWRWMAPSAGFGNLWL